MALNKKKSLIKNIVSFVIFIILIIWLSFYIKSHLNEFRDIRFLSWQMACLLLCFVFFNFLLLGLILKTILKPFGINLKFQEWFGLTMLTSVGNLFVPFGGLGFRAVYLKKKYSFDYTYFISTLTASTVIEFTIFTIGGLITLFFLYFYSGVFNLILTVLFIEILLFCLGLFFFSIPLPEFKNKTFKRIINIIKSWYELKHNRKLTNQLFVLAFCRFLSVSLTFYFAFLSFGFKISFINTFLPACLSDYSLLIRLLPASFGFYEGVIVYAAKILGFTLAQGLLVAAVIRIASLLWVLMLGLFFYYLLIMRKSKVEIRRHKIL